MYELKPEDMDHVEFVTQQWAKERPDLDVTAMGIIGRVARLYLAYQREMHKTFAQFGLNAAKFDVLATLRRSGAPFMLSTGRSAESDDGGIWHDDQPP